MKINFLQRHIALPQDHGSWVFIATPLLIGLFAGKNFHAGSLALVVAAMLAFLIRQPLTIAIKAWSGRRAKSDLAPALFWIGVYGLALLVSAGALIYLGYTLVLWLAIPAAPVFAWHLFLVSKRAERRQGGMEIVATGVLSLAAPAALWVGLGHYDAWGWALWLLTWFQAAASIVHAYLRLEQREWKQLPGQREQWRAAWRAVMYTSFNFFATLLLGFFSLLPGLIFIPFALQWAETIWGALRPAMGAKPVAIGMRQLLVSALFTILFILMWR